jgi:DNA-binding MarR family transcriptional regulator
MSGPPDRARRRTEAKVPARDVDAVLDASRALVGIAARSFAALPESVTIPQFRALVVLANVGPTPIGDLAAELGLHASTGTRLVDRLVARRLVRRVVASDDRRQSLVALTAAGQALVAAVTRRRVRDLTRVLSRLDARERRAVADAMATFAAAAGSMGDASRDLGWEPGAPAETGA